MPRTRTYCVVHGCMNQKTNENLSFFKLPKDEERRKSWLELIGRPDLLSSKPDSYCVCSLHFDKSMIRNIPQLKPGALPTKLLPGSNTFDEHIEIGFKHVSTQTNQLFDNIALSETIKCPDIQPARVKKEPKEDIDEFQESEYKCKSQLVTDAVPKILLPEPTPDIYIKIEIEDIAPIQNECFDNILLSNRCPDKISACGQTKPNNIENEVAQASLAFSSETRRKRELSDEFKESQQKRRKKKRKIQKREKSS